MKQILLATILLSCLYSFAQTNYSGVYGYSLKPQGNPPADQKNEGPGGNLVLIKIDGNKYRFWLDINKGWPSYHSGETDGTITFKNDTASFDNSYESARKECILHFKISNDNITITSTSNSADCGFGNAVSADGEYKRSKEQPVLDNSWLKQQYNQSPTATIIFDKADVYEDEDCFHKKAQYFVKGDILISIADAKGAIYTEYIAANGKYIYGWVRKTNVKVAQD